MQSLLLLKVLLDKWCDVFEIHSLVYPEVLIFMGTISYEIANCLKSKTQISFEASNNLEGILFNNKD